MARSIPDFCKLLHALRRRIMRQRFVADTVRGWLVAAGLALAVAAVSRWHSGVPRLDARICAVLAFAPVLFGIARVWTRRPDLSQVASLLDRLAQSRDRLQTALAFSQERRDVPPDAAQSAMRSLALRECGEWVRGRDLRALLPWRIPRELPWLAVPLTTLALLHWEARSTAEAQLAEAAAGQDHIAGTVAGLSTLTDALAKANEQRHEEALDRLAEALRRSTDRLRAEATDRVAAEKAVLRELSALESLTEDLRRAQAAALSPEEQRALAQALGSQPATQPAADAMKAGDLATAAQRLEEAARRLAEKADPAQATQLEQTLREAVERLAAQRAHSEALRALAQKAAGRSADPSRASELLRQLADLLRAIPPGRIAPGSQAKPGQRSPEQTLQSLLAALQQLKHGGARGHAAALADGRDAPPGAPVAMQSFAPESQSNAGTPGAADLPTGLPGSERDTGTTDSPFGKSPDTSTDKGADLALRGQLGEGESLSQMLPSVSSDDAKARRRYQEIYEAMAAAAQDAVAQENIPLGARFFIQRYFEAIRPEE